MAVDVGADALGFVFYEKSPRNIDPATAREIVKRLPGRTEKVGVFVSESGERISQVADQVGLTAVQFHGGRQASQDLASLSQCGLKLIDVCSAEKLEETGILIRQEAMKYFFALMFDSGTAAQPGGTGKTFDWERARGMVQAVSMTVPVIVAGGLNPQNVGEAVKLFQPFGVDVVSGVEAKPGKKDPDKVRAFVAAVRAAERKS